MASNLLYLHSFTPKNDVKVGQNLKKMRFRVKIDDQGGVRPKGNHSAGMRPKGNHSSHWLTLGVSG